MSQSEVEAIALQSIHNAILENVESLRTQRAGLVADISRMNDDLIEISKRLEDVRNRYGEEMTRASNEKGSLIEEIQVLRAEAVRLRQTIDGMDPIKKHIEGSISDKQMQLMRLEGRVEEARQVAEEYASQIDQARTLWNEIVGRATDETRRFDEMQKMVAEFEPHKREILELEQKLRRMRVEEADLRTAVEKASLEEADVRTRLSSLTLSYEDQKKRELDFLRKQNEAELALAKARLEHDTLMARSVELKKQNLFLNEKISHGTERKTYLDQEIQNLQGRLKGYQTSLEPLKEMIGQKEIELRRLNEELDAGRSNLRNVTSQVSDREKRIDTLMTRHEEVVAENKALDTLVGALKRQEFEYREKILIAQGQQSELEKDLARRREELGKLVSDVNNYRSQSERAQQETATLKQALSQVKSEVSEAQACKTALQNDCEQLFLQQNEARSEIERLTGESREMDRRIEAAQTEQTKLQSDSKQIRDAIAQGRQETLAVKAEVERVHKELAALDADRSAAEQVLLELNERIEKGKTSCEVLRNREAELAVVTARIRDLVKREEILKTSLGNTHRNEKAAMDRVAGLERQEGEVLGRIENGRQNLARLEETQKELSEKVNAVEKRLEKSVASLEEMNRKREGVAELLKRDAEAVRQAREHLREIEEFRNQKIREIESMRESAIAAVRSREAGERRDSALPASSAQIRAEAEKTLESLRKHLDSVLPRKEPDKGCKS
jgi:chromosome segregation ATPase